MKKIIRDFGLEWEKFNQNNLNEFQNKKIFNEYFNIFPWKIINKKSVGADFGSGSGRWSKFIAPHVDTLYLIDASKKSIQTSKNHLKNIKNIKFIHSEISDIDIEDGKLDFAFCIGVLHHTKDIEKCLFIINKTLKKNAPLLLYLYYNLENRSFIYKFIWKFTDILRIIISRMPFILKQITCEIIAFIVYLPLKYFTKFLKKFRLPYFWLPLSYYHDKEMYILRNDSLDRFGTSYEKRYSKKEIISILSKSSFNNIVFSDNAPYYCVICYKM